jgi:hypothetical protein
VRIVEAVCDARVELREKYVRKKERLARLDRLRDKEARELRQIKVWLDFAEDKAKSSVQALIDADAH